MQTGTVKTLVTSNGPFPDLLTFGRNLIFQIHNLLGLELLIGLHAKSTTCYDLPHT